MSVGLRIGLLLASIMVMVLIIVTIHKQRLNIKYSIVWILWSLLTLLMAAFPETFYGLSDFLGIQMPVNTVFLIMIGLLYGLTFYVYTAITKHNEEITKLTYEVACLKKKVEDLEKDER